MKSSPRDSAPIIGGMFGLDADKVPGLFVHKSPLAVYNGRCGIWVILKALKAQRVWLPSYLCAAVVDACKAARVSTKFYDARPGAQIRARRTFDGVRHGDVVILIDYFGFPAAPALYRWCRARGIHTIQDASQGWPGAALHADFAVFSPRKFVGVPDGGIVLARAPAHFLMLKKVALRPPPRRVARMALRSARLRARFDHSGANNNWFSVFQQSEQRQPSGAYGMSGAARSILGLGRASKRSATSRRVSRKRRENFTTLLRKLRSCAVMKTLPRRVVPLGFPIVAPTAKARDALRRHLFAHRIYPPVHWHIAGVVPRRFQTSHALSSRIMTLPCDQRYGAASMNRMADLILQALDGLRRATVSSPRKK